MGGIRGFPASNQRTWASGIQSDAIRCAVAPNKTIAESVGRYAPCIWVLIHEQRTPALPVSDEDGTFKCLMLPAVRFFSGRFFCHMCSCDIRCAATRASARIRSFTMLLGTFLGWHLRRFATRILDDTRIKMIRDAFQYALVK